MTERSRSGKTAWDKEKTRELFRRYKETGDPDAREQLVMSHMNLVRFLANKFKNRGEPLDDLLQVGYLGLLKAIDRFDPERGDRHGARFYVQPYAGVMDACRDHGGSKRHR